MKKLLAGLIALSIAPTIFASTTCDQANRYCVSTGKINQILSAGTGTAAIVKIHLNDNQFFPLVLGTNCNGAPSDWAQLSSDSMASLALSGYLAGRQIKFVSSGCVASEPNTLLVSQLYLM